MLFAWSMSEQEARVKPINRTRVTPVHHLAGQRFRIHFLLDPPRKNGAGFGGPAP